MTRLRGRLLGTGEGEEVAGLLLQGSGPGGQGEGLFGGDGGDQSVAGQGGEVGEQGAEAVDRQAVPGSPGGLLGDGGGERSALATTLARSASAASLSVSS